jgi:hypothetical protein
MTAVYGQDDASTASSEQKQEETTTKTTTDSTISHKDASFNVENEDWGSYYDPKNVFCGKYDCYMILGFDYENFDSYIDTKLITKRYRALSREWHPDKSKHKDAKERFVVCILFKYLFLFVECCIIFLMHDISANLHSVAPSPSPSLSVSLSHLFLSPFLSNIENCTCI